MAKSASAKEKSAGSKAKAKAKAKAASPSIKKSPDAKAVKANGNKAAVKAQSVKLTAAAKSVSQKAKAVPAKNAKTKAPTPAPPVKSAVVAKGTMPPPDGKAKAALADAAQTKAGKKSGVSGTSEKSASKSVQKSSVEPIVAPSLNAVTAAPSRSVTEESMTKDGLRKENPVPTVMGRALEKKGKSAEGAQKAAEKPEKKSKKSKSLNIALDRLSDLGAQWMSLYERSKELEALPYKMSGTYEAKTAIMHKVLGWGFVLSSQNDRLEVLFKDGIKILIANYKT